MWKSKNLCTSIFNNGDPINESKTNREWWNYSRQGIPTYMKVLNSEKEEIFLYNYFCFYDERGIISDGFRISTTDELTGLLFNNDKEFNNSFQIPSTGYIDKNGNHSLIDFGAYWGSNLDGAYPRFLLFNEKRKSVDGLGSDVKSCGYAVRCVSKPENDDRDFIKKTSFF